MASMFAEIQEISKDTTEHYKSIIEASDKMGFDVYPGWLEESGTVAIWNTDDVQTGSYNDFLKLGKKLGAQVIYAHRELLNLEDMLGASVEEIADSYIGIPEYEENPEEIGLDLGSVDDLNQLDGLAVYIEFCWIIQDVIHVYRKENEPLLKILDFLETQLAVNEHDDYLDDMPEDGEY